MAQSRILEENEISWTQNKYVFDCTRRLHQTIVALPEVSPASPDIVLALAPERAVQSAVEHVLVAVVAVTIVTHSTCG
jgi:hypothetical protein